MMTTARPEVVEDMHLRYLDVLRDSGQTNMYGAGTYLSEAFDLDPKISRKILKYWMASFSESESRKRRGEDA